ncbi:transporter, major facilitator family protein [Desulfitobacterium hafniense DP7]|uniref:Transporter, major facilitator family protein n=1 Tax=Desulfitobacterium hafniense DP7 TaxID=537010 RepID=G9XPP5_DESHA|nr:MFS transporter [Desulfitobacterium hafniense]EHL06373.1 transporter, major facilitator family protein [Desulfitobacterium hafniense DP7]
MNKLERNWILYDVGNSAFVLLTSTIIPIYFKNLAAADGLSNAASTAYWGYASSISTMIIAIVGPILGTVGDVRGYKKTLFLIFMAIGAAGCLALALPVGWLAFLGLYIIGKSGFSGSLIFYDAMLSDITSEERVDRVSSHGYAWGYIGSCIPFVICLGLILTADGTGLGAAAATQLAFLITALWWILCTVPLMGSYRQVYALESGGRPVRESLSRLWHTLTHMQKHKRVFTFLIAFFLYIDGVYTIIAMATSYGKDVGISDHNLLLALLLTQVVAFPFAILFARLTKKIEATRLISASIIGYLAITLFALQLDKAWEFWLLAVCVAVFQGGIQALSRSYFARIVPKEKANEFFGIFDIFGKGAAFFGMLLMSVITQITGHSRFGVLGLAVLFGVGLWALRHHVRESKNAQEF